MWGVDVGGCGGKRTENWLRQIITYVHTYTVVEQRRNGRKICSARNGSNTQFSPCASKRAPQSYFCPHRHRRSTLGTPPSIFICVNMPAVAEQEYLNPSPSRNRFAHVWTYLNSFRISDISLKCGRVMLCTMKHLTLNVWGLSYLGLTRSVSWLLMPWLLTSPGRRQDISSHDIDYVEYVGPGLTWGRIWSTCVISMWT